jgi:transcriptional regulator with XRE-family HTH domain
MSIKDLIRAGRARLQMTEQRFADALGVSRSAVQQWENGSTAPSRAHQQKVADLIGVTVGELMSGQSMRYPLPMADEHSVQSTQHEYRLTLQAEALRLFNQLSEPQQREAINYLRYLGQAAPVEQRQALHHHSVSGSKKAA